MSDYSPGSLDIWVVLHIINTASKKATLILRKILKSMQLDCSCLTIYFNLPNLQSESPFSVAKSSSGTTNKLLNEDVDMLTFENDEEVDFDDEEGT